MTISITFIEGQKGSICRHDAYAIIGQKGLIETFSVASLSSKGLTGTDLKNAAIVIVANQPKLPDEDQARQLRKALGFITR